jgi:hypothetical protein
MGTLKQITRWQHVSRLKACSFGSWKKKSLLLKMQQLILGTGTAAQLRELDKN